MADFIRRLLKKEDSGAGADRVAEDLETLCKAGDAYLETGEPAQAEISFRDAIKICPKSSAAHARLATALRRQGKDAEAIAELHEVLRNDRKNTDAYVSLAALYNNLGNFQEAAKVARMGLDICDGDVADRDLASDASQLHTILGAAYQNQGMIDESIREYRRALKIQPGNAEASRNLTNLLGYRQKVEKTIAGQKDAIEADSGNIQVYVTLAANLYNRNQYSEAFETCIKGLEVDSESADLHYLLGRLYQIRGGREDCIREYLEAVRIRPAFAEALHELAAVLEKAGRHEESTKYCGMLLALDPGNVSYRSYYVVSLFTRGLFDEAEQAIEEGLKLDPASKALLNLRESARDTRAKLKAK